MRGLNISSILFSGLRGTSLQDAPIGKESWFACGGSADWLYRPADLDDLARFLVKIPTDISLTILGEMANCIIRDKGIRGVSLQLSKGLSSVHAVGDKGHIRAEAGALNGSVAAAALKAGIGGLEFLSGIPGSVGGALAMNAGAYGTEMKDVLIGVEALTRSGEVRRWSRADLAMSYRHTEFPEWVVVTALLLRGEASSYDVIKEKLTDIKTRRNASQPIREKTGGSTFANPSVAELSQAGLPTDMRAWQVVERVGGRGLRIGGAMMSEQHCNFMINTGDACAADLEALGEELRRRAREQLGLDLHWEIKRVGNL